MTGKFKGIPIVSEFENKPKKIENPFLIRQDADGYRMVMVVGNERLGGCPENCQRCGVKDLNTFVTQEQNKQDIDRQLLGLQEELNKNKEGYERDGWHICIYNMGNITNQEEMSQDNLEHLLIGLNSLNPQPKYVSLNSRGRYLDTLFLINLSRLRLDYEIQFILGAESIKGRTEIYGSSKKHMKNELQETIELMSRFNFHYYKNYGLDVNLMFLPEFYLNEGEQREGNEQKIINGFVRDLETLIDMATAEFTLKINLHPYYSTKSGDYSSVDLNLFFQALPKIQANLEAKNQELVKSAENEVNHEKNPKKVTLFIGIEEVHDGYDGVNGYRGIVDSFNEIGLVTTNFVDRVGEILHK